jgi:hypothetical protein
VVLRTLPALWVGGKLFAVPHISYPDAHCCAPLRIFFAGRNPAAGAAFMPGDGDWAERTPACETFAGS